jgi:hypothetical protein
MTSACKRQLLPGLSNADAQEFESYITSFLDKAIFDLLFQHHYRIAHQPNRYEIRAQKLRGMTARRSQTCAVLQACIAVECSGQLGV